MAASYIRNFFSGKEFFDLFNQASANIVAMSELLVSVFEIKDFEQRVPVFNQIGRLEETGDQCSRKIYLLLDKIPFPPLNRGDIYSLTSVIDDVADYIQEATNRMYLYKLELFTEPMYHIARHLLNACNEISSLILAIRRIKSADAMINSCKNVKRIESQADQVYYKAIGSLFEEERNPIELLKQQDILLSLETAVNKCKSVADLIESVVIKTM